MKKISYLFMLGILSISLAPFSNNASEKRTNEVEVRVANSSIDYLKTLDNSSLLQKLSAFSTTGKMRAYIFSFDIDGNAIGYTEWHIYLNPVTQQDKDEKEAFFNKDADAHETTYSKVNILNGTYDMATTYADCSGTGFTYFKAVRDGQTLWIKTPAGYGPTPSFIMAYNVKDPGRPGQVIINNLNSTNSYGYSISNNPTKPQEETHEVVFDANGGMGTMSNQVVTKGQPFVLPKNTFTRAGYTFAGWSLEPNGIVKYTDGQEVVDFAFPQSRGVSTTLYAVWQPIKQSVQQPQVSEQVPPTQVPNVKPSQPITNAEKPNATPTKGVKTGTNSTIMVLSSVIIGSMVILVVRKKVLK